MNNDRSVTAACVGAACLVMALLPALAAGDAESDFQMLFGDEIKRVNSSGSGKKAAALAAQMLKAADIVKDSPDLRALLWARAAEFGAKDPTGHDTAVKALKHLLESAPEQKARWEDKLLAVYHRRYTLARGKGRAKAGTEYIEQLIAVADAQVAAGRAGEAVAAYRKALFVASAVRSPRRAEILQKMKSANAAVAAQRRIETLKRILAKDPDNAKTRVALIRLYLLELDSPTEAAKLLTDDLDEELRTYLPLSAKKPEELQEAACLEMGQWYWALFPDAETARGKATALRRAKAYLQRFGSLHEAEDGSRLKAALIIKQVDKELARLSGGPVGPLTKPAVIADFETSKLPGWRATGKAFGPGPCDGRPFPQYPAGGFAGKGMISSYHGGDNSTGALTSPKFVIRGRSITFLVGGGSYPGETCMNLVVDGKVVRTVAGHNSNTLRPAAWDVSDLVGKTAVLQIIDARKGHWAHILIDDIVQRPEKLKDRPGRSGKSAPPKRRGG